MLARNSANQHLFHNNLRLLTRQLSLKSFACPYYFECDFFIAKDSDGVIVIPQISLKVFNEHIKNFFRIGSLVVPDNRYQRSILSLIPGLSGSKRTGLSDVALNTLIICCTVPPRIPLRNKVSQSSSGLTLFENLVAKYNAALYGR
jgi:hypothetical protein